MGKRSVTELIAGKRQGNIVSSLMTNFDTARDALETSLNSSGSAMREHEKWSQSLESRLNKLKSTWQSLSQSFMSSDFLKAALDGIIGLVNGLDKLIDTVGTLPTLLGLAAGGLSAFKNKGLLTFDKDAKSIQVFNSSFKDLGGEFKRISTGISTYNSILTKSKGLQDAYVGSINNHNSSFGKYLSGLNGAKASMGGYITSLVGAKVASFALQAATIALNAAITMGVSFLISGAISLIQKWINAKEELAEKVDEVTSSFKEQHTELVKNKSSFESQAKRYSQLAKGVDDLGNNVSLTADEYAEYQDIVNSIANQVPSLIQGYDAQGNAILNYKGNVEELTAAYEDLIKKQNDSVLKGDAYKDIEKDFKNAMEDAKSGDGGFMKTKASLNEINALEALLKSENLDELIPKINEKYGANLNYLINELESAGIDKMKVGESYDEFIKRAVTQNKDIVQRVVNDFNANLDAEAEGMRTAAQAALSKAFDFSDSEYKDISDKTQSLIRQIVGNFDAEQFDKITQSGKTVEEYINDMLDSFKSMSDGDTAQLEAAFNLETKFNNGEISYGEYIKGIQNAENLINGLDIDDDVKSQIKLTLDTENIKTDYDALKKRLTEKYELNMETEKAEKKAEKFLNGLSASEYQVAIDLIDDKDVNFDDFDSIKELRKYIKEQAALVEALNYTISMDIETEGLDALNTAMAESVSGAGLSSEAIAALKSRYAELESEGYNLSVMFEETANGIHLNKRAISEFEQALATQKLSETQDNLDVLKNRYDELTTEIDNCTDAGERAALYREQQSIVQKINDLGTLASQYEGLTSAYNAWLAAEESGSERDMYEKVIEGFETVGDEIKRGWIDDSTIKFLELMTGETDLAAKSAGDLKKIWDGLDKNIKNTSYSVSDFFTTDKDGNSTSQGVYNFLNAIQELESSNTVSSVLGKQFKDIEGIEKLVEKKDGKIVGFNFDIVGGDEAIAEALGISEELVQIMLRAADDAGFVVTLDGNWTQFADLKNQAEQANDSLKKIAQTNDDLKKAGFGEYEFKFDASDIETLDQELTKAKELLNNNAFKGKDGKFNIDAKGAKDALKIAETLQIAKSKLEEPAYMSIDTTKLQKELQKPVEQLQEFERLTQERDLLNLTGTDTKRLKEIDGELDKIATNLSNLDEQTKIKLGIEGMTPEQIRKELENGTIEVPAQLTIEANMDKSLEDLLTLGLFEHGFITEKEAKIRLGIEVENKDDVDQEIENNIKDENDKTIKLDKKFEIKPNVKINDSEQVLEDIFGKYDDHEIEVITKFLADPSEVENYNIKDKEAVIRFIADTMEVDGYTPEEKKAYARYLVDGGNIDSYTPEQKQAIVEYLTDSGDPDNWTPEQKEAVAKFKKDSAEVDNYSPEDRQAIAKFIKNSIEPDRYVPSNKEATVKYWKDSKIPDGYQPANKTATVTFWAQVKKKASDLWSKITGSGGVDGTAHIDGTAFVNGTTAVSGRAFKQGDWGTKSSGIALGGEEAPELLVRNGRWHLIGERGAEFFGYKKGDIIFNASQTKEIFEKGKITHGNGRGKALVSGTAFSSGTGGGLTPSVSSTTVKKKKTTTTKNTTKNTVTGKSYDKSKDKSSTNDFEETFDLIEIKISRLERAIDRLDQKASGTWRSWSSRNKALTDELAKVGDEIDLQEKAYDKYIAAANATGLSSAWKQKVRDGSLNISTVKDETLAEKIKDYQTYYEKALACKDAIADLRDKEAELAKQQFDNIAAKYDAKIDRLDAKKSIAEENITQSKYTTKSGTANTKNYKSLIELEEKTLDKLQAEKEELKAFLENSGIAKYTEDWYEMQSAIDDVSVRIEESTTNILESYEQMFDGIAEKYGATIDRLQGKQDIYQTRIDRAQYTTKATNYNGTNYRKIVAEEQKVYDQLVKQKEKQQAALDDAVANGLEKGSPVWQNMQAEVNATTLAMEESALRASQAYGDMFDFIGGKYDGILQGYDHTESMLNEYIAQAEAQGHIVSTKYYDELIKNEESNINTLKKQQADMVAIRDEALASGKIVKGSEEWYRMSAAIDEVTQEIEASETAIINYANAIRDIEWETFELGQERLSKLTSEAEFLIELMSDKKLHDDNGQLTDEGKATMGLYAQNYNVEMRKADNYGAEAQKIQDRMALDPSDENYLDPLDQNNVDKYYEYLELQQQSILNANQQKNAIRDLVEEGYNKELDALQEKIDKQNESLQSAKDLYEYNKKVKDQTKEIANLEKQMAAYSGDDSEEARQKIQQIKVQLEEAKADLEETEYEKMISDSEKLLDNLYNEYETILNSRLDNVDALVSEAITSINDNAGVIAQTLYSSADQVGYTMSEEMNGIWAEAKQNADAENQRRIEQTQAIVNQLVANGTLTQEQAQAILTTLGTGNAQSAQETLDLINQMVANGTLAQQDANNIITALSLGNQQQVADTLAMLQELVADGKLSQQDAQSIITALVTGDADDVTNANNIITQLVANGTLAKGDADRIIEALNGAKAQEDKIVSEYNKDADKEESKKEESKVDKVVNKVEEKVENAVKASDEEATTEIKKNSTTTAAKKDPTKDHGTKPTVKTPTPTKKEEPKKNNGGTKKEEPKKEDPKKDPKKDDPKKTSGGDGKAKVGDKVKFVSGKYYASSDGLKPTGTKNQGKQVYITKINTASWATYPYHISTGKKLGSGDLGWLKLKQLSGYASGKKKISDNEYAWTQENGQEFIVRPSDGAILTPVAKGDSVLNATASGNIWSMANNPAEFIKNNLGLDSANVPNGSNVQNNLTQHLENVTFSFPNVHSYDEMLKQLQKDKSFEKLIMAMTIDRVAGKSALAKGKAIR